MSHLYYGPTAKDGGVITPGRVVYVEKAQPLPSSLVVAYDGVNGPLLVSAPHLKRVQRVQKVSTPSMTVEEARKRLGLRPPRVEVRKATSILPSLARYCTGQWG